MSKLAVGIIESTDVLTDLVFTTSNTNSGNIRVFSSNNTILFSGNPVFTGTLPGLGAPFNQANAAFGQANTAYTQANTAQTTAVAAFGQANTAQTTAVAAFGQANTAQTTAVAAFGQANTAPVAASQAEQEAGTSTTTYVSPGRQHFHPSAAKFWAHFGTAGNLLAGYNVTSITDNGTGVATVVISTDFSSSDYCAGVAIENLDATIDSVADGQISMIANANQLADSIRVLCKNDSTTAAADPATWNVWGFGDLA